MHNHIICLAVFRCLNLDSIWCNNIVMYVFTINSINNMAYEK